MPALLDQPFEAFRETKIPKRRSTASLDDPLYELCPSFALVREFPNVERDNLVQDDTKCVNIAWEAVPFAQYDFRSHVSKSSNS